MVDIVAIGCLFLGGGCATIGMIVAVKRGVERIWGALAGAAIAVGIVCLSHIL